MSITRSVALLREDVDRAAASAGTVAAFAVTTPAMALRDATAGLAPAARPGGEISQRAFRAAARFSE